MVKSMIPVLKKKRSKSYCLSNNSNWRRRSILLRFVRSGRKSQFPPFFPLAQKPFLTCTQGEKRWKQGKTICIYVVWFPCIYHLAFILFQPQESAEPGNRIRWYLWKQNRTGSNYQTWNRIEQNRTVAFLIYIYIHAIYIYNIINIKQIGNSPAKWKRHS